MSVQSLHALRSTYFKPLQFLNAESPSQRSDAGATKDSSPESSNAFVPMVSRASPVKMTRFRNSHYLKASLSMYLTLLGRTSSSNVLEAKFS